jgi:hypothetical protein
MEILATIIVIALVIGFVVFKRKPAATAPGTAASRGASARPKSGTTRAHAVNAVPRNPHRATSVFFDDAACATVRALSDRRFLDTERNTPSLPLAGCDAAQCNCRYVRHEDRRRSDEDRRNPNALKSELYDRSGETNRRARRRGRRKTDWA